MKTIPTTRFQCEVCKHVYETAEAAAKCESRPVSQDRGVKVGDRVMITAGDGVGHWCEIDAVYVLDREWGHYAWERYWHTVAVNGKVIGSWGSRMLTFDNYRTASEAETVSVRAEK